jgi:hypothetical protein
MGSERERGRVRNEEERGRGVSEEENDRRMGGDIGGERGREN